MRSIHGKHWLDVLTTFPHPANAVAKSIQRLFFLNIFFGIITFTIVFVMITMIILKSSTLSAHPFPYANKVNECDSVKCVFILYPSVILAILMYQSHIHLEYHVGEIIKEEPKMIVKITGNQ